MYNELKKHTKEIKGHSYEIMPFPAMYGLCLMNKFGATIGSAFRSIGATAGYSMVSNSIAAEDAAAGMGELGSAIHALLIALHTKDPKGEMILEIMSQTMRDGKAINKTTFDEFYTGNMSEMLEALIATINVQFKNFLEETLRSGVLSTLGKATQESSES